LDSTRQKEDANDSKQQKKMEEKGSLFASREKYVKIRRGYWGETKEKKKGVIFVGGSTKSWELGGGAFRGQRRRWKKVFQRKSSPEARSVGGSMSSLANSPDIVLESQENDLVKRKGRPDERNRPGEETVQYFK